MSPSIHPLWDPEGFYRLALHRDDDGKQGLRHFFWSRSRQELADQWMLQIPQEAQDWGFGEGINAEIHEYHRRIAEFANLANQVEGPQETTPARIPVATRTGRPGPILRPASLVFVEGNQPEFVFCDTAGSGIFPFIGESRQDMRLFLLNVPNLPNGHRCLVMLLLPETIAQLAGFLELAPNGPGASSWLHGGPHPTEIQTTAEARAVLEKALSRKTLAQDQENPPALRRAFKIATLLALAPSVEGITMNHRFLTQVDLGRTCPSLDPGSWVVTCVGPEAADSQITPTPG